MHGVHVLKELLEDTGMVNLHVASCPPRTEVRYCGFAGCGTRLASYNHEQNCSIHQRIAADAGIPPEIDATKEDLIL